MNPSDPSQVPQPTQPVAGAVPPVQPIVNPVPETVPQEMPSATVAAAVPEQSFGVPSLTPPAPLAEPMPQTTAPVMAPAPEAYTAPVASAAPVAETPAMPPAEPAVVMPAEQQPVAWSGDAAAQTTVVAPQPMAVPTGMPSDPYSGMSASPKKGKLRVVVSAIVALVVLGGAATGASQLLHGAKKYTAKDLVTTVGQHYSLSYPKEWKDVSSNKTLLSSALGSSSGITDVKAYAYNVSKDNKTAEAFVLAADQSSGGFTDSELKQALQDSTVKKSFEDELTTSTKDISGASSGCAKASSPQTNFEYNTKNFVAAMQYDVDCQQGTDATVKSADHHLSATIGLKNGKAFLLVIGSVKSDWARNSEFYKNNMIVNFQPQ